MRPQPGVDLASPTIRTCQWQIRYMGVKGRLADKGIHSALLLCLVTIRRRNQTTACDPTFVSYDCDLADKQSRMNACSPVTVTELAPLHQAETPSATQLYHVHTQLYHVHTHLYHVHTQLHEQHGWLMQVDLVDFSGPDFSHVDKRCVALRLVEKGLCDAALFNPSGASLYCTRHIASQDLSYRTKRSFHFTTLL